MVYKKKFAININIKYLNNSCLNILPFIFFYYTIAIVNYLLKLLFYKITITI